MTSEVPAKRQKSSKDAGYKLIYWPGLPGRGEHIRLAFEEAGVPYVDTSKTETAVPTLLPYIGPDYKATDGNVPPLAPPLLEHGDLLISQTPNILQYLGPRLGLVAASADGAEDDDIYRINALALTALDGLSNEVHDCHHPICTSLYYEDQKTEAIRSSKQWVTERLPKFFGYFERVLAAGSNGWLFRGTLTYADLVLFQCVDGTAHQFPKAVAQAKESGNYSKLFALHEAVKARPNIAAYLASDRRAKYGDGIYRYYDDLDVLPEKKEEEKEEEKEEKKE